MWRPGSEQLREGATADLDEGEKAYSRGANFAEADHTGDVVGMHRLDLVFVAPEINPDLMLKEDPAMKRVRAVAVRPKTGGCGTSSAASGRGAHPSLTLWQPARLKLS